jgi:hypothetical protein
MRSISLPESHSIDVAEDGRVARQIGLGAEDAILAAGALTNAR